MREDGKKTAPVNVDALFLGPKGENRDFFTEMLGFLMEDYIEWRHYFHPEDGESVLTSTKERGDFKDTLWRTRLALTDLLAGLSCWLLDLTVMQVGRTAFVVVYLNPNQPMDGAAIDLIRDRIEERCRELLRMPVRSEVILTATPPFGASGTS